MSELDTQNKHRQPDADPIARLHKMSTTAGVAAQDYVAINTLAVVTAVLGVASALAFLGTYFLVIGLAAIVFGVIALKRIRQSNGTEGGRWLAWSGIAIAVILAGVILAMSIAAERAQDVERGRIRQVIADLGKAMAAGDYDRAYALYDPVFRQTWTTGQFKGIWELWQDPKWVYGKVQEMRDNGIISFPTSSADRPIAWTKVLVRCQGSQAMRISTEFVKGDDGQWRISQMYEPFQPERQRR